MITQLLPTEFLGMAIFIFKPEGDPIGILECV
ncbi:Uncharacterised protein [Vibrio cholerae]|nr:Uncharacterised protein [Vibrio cholerae]